MKRTFYTIFFLTIFLSLNSTFAGNLSKIKFNFEFLNKIPQGDKTEIQIEGENVNKQYAVSGISINYQITDTKLNSVVYSKTQDVEDVQPGTKFNVNLGMLPWSYLLIGGSYKLSLLLQANYDEDMSDNTLTKEFEVIGNKITREAARDIILSYLLKNYTNNQLMNSNVFLTTQILLIGTMIYWDYLRSQYLTTTKDHWIGYADWDVDASLSHKSSMFLVDANSGVLETKNFDWRPQINNSYYPNNEQWKNDLIYGNPIQYEDYDENGQVYDITEPVNDLDSVGCFLISGTGTNDRERSAFPVGVNVMRREFTLEKTGPKISVDRLEEFKDNPNGLSDAISTLNNKYKKMYIYYSGHSDTSGQMIFTDGIMSFIDLIRELKAQGVQEICMIIDACYSGKVIEEFQNDQDLADMSVTLITSASKDSVSKLRFVNVVRDGKTIETGVGAFTNSLATALGSPDADKNKDNTVSLIEAFESVLDVNPKISENSNTRINDQKPQIFTHERRIINSEKISFENSDLDFTVNYGLNNKKLNVNLYRGQNLFKSPDNPSIYKASVSRIWDIEVIPNNTEKFDVDLEFYINDTWDDLGSGIGIPGVIVREFETDLWKPYYPTVYNSTKNMVRISGVNQFSQWALARIEENNSVNNTDLPNLFIKQHPNPFTDAFNIEIAIDYDSKINLDILDLFGNRKAILADELLTAGNYIFRFDGKDLTIGIYYIRMKTNGLSKTYKIIKQ
jgi:hypothetical protein